MRTIVRLLDPDGTLHKSDPDMCCHIRKTAPLENALSQVRRVDIGPQAVSRRRPYRDSDARNGRWSLEDRAAGPLHRQRPRSLYASLRFARHPLLAEGYRSIGCMPCTTKGGTVDNPRAGRWFGTSKTECGIHWTANGRPINLSRS